MHAPRACGVWVQGLGRPGASTPPPSLAHALAACRADPGVQCVCGLYTPGGQLPGLPPAVSGRMPAALVGTNPSPRCQGPWPPAPHACCAGRLCAAIKRPARRLAQHRACTKRTHARLSPPPCRRGVAQPSTVTFHLAELSDAPPDSVSNVTVYQTLVQVGREAVQAACRVYGGLPRSAHAGSCAWPAAPGWRAHRLALGCLPHDKPPLPPPCARWCPMPATLRRCSPPGAAGAAPAAPAAILCRLMPASGAACWTARRAAVATRRCCRPARWAAGPTAQPRAATRWVGGVGVGWGPGGRGVRGGVGGRGAAAALRPMLLPPACRRHSAWLCTAS